MPNTQVMTTTAGQPLRVEVDGHHYRVAADPVRWYERRAWWTEVDRAPKDQCPYLVDREVWQVQVTVDLPAGARRRRGAVRDRELRTLHLERDRATGGWDVVENL
ncbi:hypothetical protein ACIGDM_12625 [Rothia koreensis]|jgi:hypothetical protein|uniref:hypothetical protein n=1 Tax=Rothia koreensis TaxID=592378 RepID=UPI0015BDCB9D